ncbi:hypothetical protein MKW94_004473 [Papaver nudicaule]|uniref:MADS-box domain-containing protein n=1 Tax=Papaver nudicaule TaxID=74823 RepID=A0AA41VFX1_PAPNU|nr:hypothetical protein [Papaver nudicaule]
MDKRKIEVKKIQDRKKRNVAFTKRRNGLFKKVELLSELTGANISLIVFSPGGNLFTFSSADESGAQFLNRFVGRQNEGIKDEVLNTSRVNADWFWWEDINLEELDTVDKVLSVKNQLIAVKNQVLKRKKELLDLDSTSGKMDECCLNLKEKEQSLEPSSHLTAKAAASTDISWMDESCLDLKQDEQLLQPSSHLTTKAASADIVCMDESCLDLKQDEQLLESSSHFAAKASDDMDHSFRFSVEELDANSWLPSFTFDDMDNLDEFFKD